MSGCAHMNPAEWCASCLPAKYDALREENARLRASTLPDVVPEDVDTLREENARLTSEVERVKLLLGRAAQEINCAGPVDHRIRVMRREYSELVDRLTRERDEARAEVEP